MHHFPHARLPPMFGSPPNSAFQITHHSRPSPLILPPLVAFSDSPQLEALGTLGTCHFGALNIGLLKIWGLGRPLSSFSSSAEERSYLIIWHRIHSMKACWMSVPSWLPSVLFGKTQTWSCHSPDPNKVKFQYLSRHKETGPSQLGPKCHSTPPAAHSHPNTHSTL